VRCLANRRLDTAAWRVVVTLVAAALIAQAAAPTHASGAARLPRKAGAARSPLIIGGGQADPAAWPFIAMIVINTPQGSFLCSGSRIAADWVLTAAHCVSDAASNTPLPAGDLQVAVGDLPAQTRTDWVTAQRAIRSPAWDPRRVLGDAALVRIGGAPVRDPVTLAATGSEPSAPARVLIAGWGTTIDQSTAPSSLPDLLPTAETQLWQQSVCQAAWGAQVFDPATQLCAGSYTTQGQTQPTACHGDSGGPLISVSAAGVWRLIGITSYGANTSCLALPTVYTRVTAIRDWVLRTTGLGAPRITTARLVTAGPRRRVIVVIESRGVRSRVRLVRDGRQVIGEQLVAASSAPATISLPLAAAPTAGVPLTVTASNAYGASVAAGVSGLPTLPTLPSVTVTPVTGHHGRVVTIRFAVAATTATVGYTVRLYASHRTLVSWSHAPTSPKTQRLAVRWHAPVHPPRGLRICVWAFDHTRISPAVCVPVSLS
jgi:hypothetical protein